MTELDPELKITGTFQFKSCIRPQKDFWRQKFIESNDPTGYTFAERWVEDGYRKWPSIVNGYGCKEEIREWQETLHVKLQAQGILNVASQRESFQAGKWLADRGWLEKQDKRTKEAKKAAEKVTEEIHADMERLGLRLVETK